MKIWDLRSTYNCLAEITLATPAVTMDFSQMGLLALGSSITVQVSSVILRPFTPFRVIFSLKAEMWEISYNVGL